MGDTSDTTPPANGDQSETVDLKSLADSVKELRSEFTETQKSVHGRISDFGKQLAAFKKPNGQTSDSKTNGETPAPKGPTQNDLLAAMEFGRTLQKLPDEAAEHLTKLVKDEGRSLSEVLERAQDIARFSATGGTPEQKIPPKGTAGTASPASSGAVPTTITELKALKKDNPARYKELMDPFNSEFDPNTLIHR